MTMDIRRFRYVAALIAAVCVAAGIYAFTASNTVPGSKAGSGSGAITGYTVSNIHYTPNATDPRKLDAVAFTLDAAAGTVKAQVDTVAGDWYSCTNTSGNNWSCDTTSPQANVQPADQLSVVATS
jgi:archaellin